jgi:hypothetical protein
VLKAALFVGASTCVSIIRAFEGVLIWTISTLFAIAQFGERTAHWGIHIDLHMRISAVGFCATTTREVNAGGRSVGRKIMRKGTSRSSRTGTFHEELFAYSNLVDIVGELAVPRTLT